MDFNGNDQEQDVTDLVEKTQLQSFVAPGTTNFNGNLTLNGVPVGSGGGGGDVFGPANSADNGVCFYSGVSGKIIKEVATIKYNPIPNSLAVPDLSTTVTTSLNTDLQKISNITSAVQLPTPVTEFNGEISSSGNIKVYDPTGADPDNSLLTKDRISFRGDPTFTSNGVVRYLEDASNRIIEMTIDSGNFSQASTGRIIVDGRTYTFTQDFLNMDTKRIVGIGAPIGVLDATNKQYVDQKFVDPVINSSITLENQTTPNTLLLASFATGENRIDSAGDLEINGSNLTMNLTGGTLTENVGNNKISIISGNVTENISANKVVNTTASHISTASSHTFNGALTSTTSVSTPILTGISTITNAGSDITVNTPGGELILNNDALIVNSVGGIRLQQGALDGIQLGANPITTTKTTFNNNELVTKQYVDARSSSYELIFAVTNQISNIISTGQKFQIRAPRDFTISKFKLSLNTTAGANFSVTIRKNGTTVSSVFLNALVQNTIITETFLENDIISVDVSNIGNGLASGLICYLLE